MSWNNRDFHNPEYRVKKRKNRLRKFYIFLVLFLVILGCMGALTHIRQLTINTITVSGTVVLNSQDIIESSETYISGNYFFIFSKNNAALYPRVGLEENLKKAYPRIKDVSIELTDIHTLHIELSEREPSALWCDTPPNQPNDSSTSIDSVSNCYFLDETGFVFSHAPDFSGDAYFKYYGLLPYASPIGSSYLSSSTKFAQVNQFVKAVKDLHITPLYVVASTTDDFVLNLYGGGVILFDDRTSLDDSADHLRRVLDQANLVPKQNGELLVDYIDLRYGDKVFYKVRQ